MVSKELFDLTVNILEPFMGDDRERKAIIQKALIECRVLSQIEWEGGTHTFTVHLVQRLITFGECSPGKLALVMLLEDLKTNVGDDKAKQIDDVIEAYYLDGYSTPNNVRFPQISLTLTDHSIDQKTESIFITISYYQTACQNDRWALAYTLLQEISARPQDIPFYFSLEGHKRWIERELQYDFIYRMSKASRPDNVLIWQALEVFWRSYPGYDPHNLKTFKQKAAQYYFDSAENTQWDEYDSKISHYTESIDIDPSYTEAYIKRAETYITKGMHDIYEYKQGYSMHLPSYEFCDQAIADYRIVQQLDPQSNVNVEKRIQKILEIKEGQ